MFKGVSSSQDVSRKFEECFKKNFRVFQERMKGVLRKIEGCFKGVFSGYPGHLKEIRVFLGSLMDVSQMLPESFREVPNVFQGSFKGVP